MGRSFHSVLASAALSAAAFCASTVSAQAQEGLALTPSSDWRFREYDDRCRISRNFGEGEDRTALWIEQGGAEPNYNITLIGRPLRNPYGAGVRIRFGEEPEIIRSYVAAESSRGRPVLLMYGVAITQPELERDDDEPAPEISFDPDRAAAISTLRLRAALVKQLTLDVGSLAEPLAFLDECGIKLAGLLSEAGRALTGEASPPVPIEPDTWLRESDYPDYLLSARMEGQVLVRLTVNAAGKASACYVTGSNKPQLFSDAVCLGLIQRARFEPARNAQGEPVASYYPYGIRFQIN